jgi:hypothetical protein
MTQHNIKNPADLGDLGIGARDGRKLRVWQRGDEELYLHQGEKSWQSFQ